MDLEGAPGSRTARSPSMSPDAPLALTHDTCFYTPVNVIRLSKRGRYVMAEHSSLSHQEAADRLAIRELFDGYAHCADTRDAEGQKALFATDARFAVYLDGLGSEASYVLEGREALSPVFNDLKRYEATMHFNGQSTVFLEGPRA